MVLGTNIDVSRGQDVVKRLELDEEVLRRVQGLDLTDRIRDVKLTSAVGAFSDLATGILDGLQEGEEPVKIAAKRLRFYLKTTDMKLLFEKELYVWSKLDHKNILPFLGFTFQAGFRYPLLISPWIEKGTLKKYAEDNPNASMLPMVVGVAKGLQYMHRKGFIHSDIKASNVLVSNSEPPGALICDLGAARIIDPSLPIGKPSSGQRGTIPWLSPEAHEGGPHSMEADVWAFGMTVYEILMRTTPYSHYRSEHQVRTAILQGQIPSYPAFLTSEPDYFGCLKKLSQECWNKDVKLRIDMNGVLKLLRPFIQEVECLEHLDFDINQQLELHVEVNRRFHHESPSHAIFSLDGEYFAVVCGKVAFVYDVDSGKLEWSLDHLSDVKSLCFSTHDSEKIVTFANDHNLRIWEQQECDAELECQQDITSLVFSPRDRFLAIGLGNGDTQIRYRIFGRTKTLKGPISASKSAITSVAISPDSQLVATSCEKGIVCIWNVQEASLVKELSTLQCPFSSAAFIGTNLNIVSGSQTTIRLWEMYETMSDHPTITYKEFQGDTDEVLTAAVSPDRKLITSGSKVGTIHIWDQESGQLAKTLAEHGNSVNSVKFSPSGGTIVSTSQDGQVILWNYNTM